MGDVDRLYDHLAATAELPLDRDATRWIAEAEAVADDARDIDDPEVVRTRIGHVRELLAHVETTGHEAADEHLAAAKSLAAELAEGPVDDLSDDASG
jgi:hypothetical protein